MKKKIQLIFAVIFVLSLTACGVPQEKLDTAQSTYDELVSLCDRAEAATQNIEQMDDSYSLTDGTNDYSSTYAELQEYRDSYAEAMEVLGEMKESEVDTLIQGMQEEIDASSEIVTLLEDMATTIQKITDLAVLVEDNASKLVEYITNNPSEAYYNALTDLISDLEAFDSREKEMEQELNELDFGDDTEGELNAIIAYGEEIYTLLVGCNEKIEATMVAVGI